MGADTSTNKSNKSSPTPYKDPISASIIEFLAIILLFIGIVAIIIPFIATAEVKSQLKNTVFFSLGSQFADATLIPCFLFAIVCFILSTVLFVLSSIACDAHFTEYNLRQLLLNTQQNRDDQIKLLQHLEDTINRHNSESHHQISNENSSTGMS